MTNAIGQKLIMPDFFNVMFDGNGAVVIGDSKKGLNTIKSEVAGVIKGNWGKDAPLMPYKTYVQKILVPGNKYDKEIKKAQEEIIEKIFENIKESHPQQYAEAMNLYKKLEKKYYDQETRTVKFTIFKSITDLIERIQKAAPFSITLRTFGSDGKKIAQEFAKSGIIIDRNADMFQNGVCFDGDKEVTSGPQLLKELQKTHTIGQDQFKVWYEHNFQAAFSKIIPCVEDGIFEKKIVVTLFIDDNLKKISKEFEGMKLLADPEEENIAYPKDVYGRPTSWESKGIIGIRINPVKAALDQDYPDYVVKKVNKQLSKRGFATI